MNFHSSMYFESIIYLTGEPLGRYVQPLDFCTKEAGAYDYIL